MLNFLLKKSSRKDFQRKIEGILNDPDCYALGVHSYRPILTEMMGKFHDVVSTLQSSIEGLEVSLAQHKEKLEECSQSKMQLLSSGISSADKKN